MKFTRKFKAGHVIFREGEASSNAYYILSGGVRISVGEGPQHRILGDLGVGELFGEMGLIDDKPRIATATALTDVELEIYDESSFEEAVLGDPDRLRSVLAAVLERLRTVDTLLLNELARKNQSPSKAFESRPEAPPAVEGTVHFESDGPLPDGSSVSLRLDKFPFRIGRMTSCKVLAENDILLEDERPHHVSRGHCAIEMRAGALVVRDRGSAMGTIVNGTPIGTGAETFVAPLAMGTNVLVLGRPERGFKFRVTVA